MKSFYVTDSWIYEDQLPDNYPYDFMFEYSEVIDGVRMFPVFRKIDNLEAMRVIYPDQWEPCSPSWIERGGCCATSPRVWNEAEHNHYHPKIHDNEEHNGN